ncbi:MAG: zinc ribbon domain-containing protein [Bacilli bacterium]|nr:zinc ribbon domain-containing protein [Bacilli bacterium]
MAIFGVILIVLMSGVVLAMLGFYLVGLWKLFEKAGRNGWEAIIPFYNTWVLAEISGMAWWYALIIIFSNLGVLGSEDLGLVLSLAAMVAEFFIFYNLSKKFHRDTGFAILMTFFPFVMIPIMGFSKDFQYDKDIAVSENGPIDNAKNNENTYNDDSENRKVYEENAYSSSSVNVKDKNNNSKIIDDNNSKSSEVIYCSNCGKKVIIGAKFCGNCGKEIDK